MNVTGFRTRIFDPVLSRAEFGEYPTGTKLLCRSIVMLIGEDLGEQVDDRGIALMAVQTDMTAWRHDRTAETQFMILNAVDFLGEVNGREHLFADQMIVGGCGTLPQSKPPAKSVNPADYSAVM